MKADENAAGAKKRSTKAFYPELAEGKGCSISYIYCERLNLLLRSVNDLTTTTGVCRGKSKPGTLSKRLEKPRSHPEHNLHLQLQALNKSRLSKKNDFRLFADRTSSWRTEESTGEDLSLLSRSSDFEALI
jgi:hypothetical protein